MSVEERVKLIFDMLKHSQADYPEWKAFWRWLLGSHIRNAVADEREACAKAADECGAAEAATLIRSRVTL